MRYLPFSQSFLRSSLFLVSFCLSQGCHPFGKLSHTTPKDPQAAKVEPKTEDANSNNKSRQSSMEPFLGIWSYSCEADVKNSMSSKASIHITPEKWDFVTTVYGYRADCTGDIPFLMTSTFLGTVEGPSAKIVGATDAYATFVSYSAMPLLPLGMETLQKMHPDAQFTLFKSSVVQRSGSGKTPLSPGEIHYTSMKIIQDRLCFSDTSTQFGETKETRGDKLENKDTCAQKTDRLN